MRIPSSTYRLQFSPNFRFAHADRLVPYLEALGVSDVYASPIMAWGPDIQNSYQVTDHGRLNPMLGSEEGLDGLSRKLRERDMGLLLDIVPNHMCIASEENQWWNDVLENGPASSYASYFDIDWEPPRQELKNQVLLPILGDQFGRVLERGELRVVYRNGSFYVKHFDRHLPTNPNTWVDILEPVITDLGASVAPNDPALMELKSILTAVRNLPPMTEIDASRLEERRRENAIIKSRLRQVVEGSSEIFESIERVLTHFNGTPGEPRSFDSLESLLDKQCYRLSYWRVANLEINYRRFFDINELAGLKVEEFEVFLRVHQFIFRMVRNQWVTGLRVDHVDGLFDPEQYLRQLQQGCGIALTTNGKAGDRMYVVVEKIFTGSERLPVSWMVEGTTGYDFANSVNGLFVHRQSAEKIRSIYEHFGGNSDPVHWLIYLSKALVLTVALGSEWQVLSRQLDRTSEQDRSTRDFTLENLKSALRDVVACFPVYRSYIQVSDGRRVRESDKLLVREAIRRARRLNPTTSPLIYDFIQNVLILEDPPGLSDIQRKQRGQFIIRFQQLTAPTMAKGVEDTAFYRRYPLLSLNEVGGDPYTFGTTIGEFHRANSEKVRDWPHSLNATSTHDSKRSEDVRARINVLSEAPDLWEAALWRWRKLNEGYKVTLDPETTVPHGNEEYLLYQTVFGMWPEEEVTADEHTRLVERVKNYMRKATREAKVHTSWINPDEQYDAALFSFIDYALKQDGPFLKDLADFLPPFVHAGYCNSLSQLVLKLAAPGVPDLYQGSELWNFSLVDPDNRGEVDYAPRVRLLAELLSRAQLNRGELAQELFDSLEDGRLKLYVTALGLRLRRKLPRVFAFGAYEAIDAIGERASQLIAFSRTYTRQRVIAAVARFFSLFSGRPLGKEAWGETALLIPPGAYLEVFTGQEVVSTGEVPVSTLFTHLPFILLREFQPYV